MASDKLFPAFVQIEYSSPFAQGHTMTLCMRAIATTGLGDAGTVETWSGATLSVAEMVEDMIDAMATGLPSTIVFNAYTVYSVPAPFAPPQPIFTSTYTKAGTETGLTGQAKAVQVTLSFRTELFGQARIVLLDRPVNGNFGSFIDPSGDLAPIISEFTDPTNAWAGRDNSRPAAYTNTSITLNKRLRRKYGMI